MIKYKDYSYVIGIDEIEVNRYNTTINNGVINNGNFIPNNKYDEPSWFNSLTSICIDYFQICDIQDDLIRKLNRIKEKRNDFIHEDKPHFDKNELRMILNVINKVTKEMRE
jgi:hypothetical protein